MTEAASRGRAHRARAILTTILLASGLAGCVDQMPEVHAGRGDIRNAIARGQLTSPRAATVALVSLEGAPDDVSTRFRASLSSEAASREIAITDAASARYLVRGYLAAYPGDQGVTVSYTYDVFDAGDHRRRERVSDTIEVPPIGADPWGAVSEPVLASLVGRSADDLAVALAGTPEAQAAAGKVAASTTTAATPVN